MKITLNTVVCSVEQCINLQCSEVRYNTVQCSVVQCINVYCNLVQCIHIKCSVVVSLQNEPEALTTITKVSGLKVFFSCPLGGSIEYNSFYSIKFGIQYRAIGGV